MTPPPAMPSLLDAHSSTSKTTGIKSLSRQHREAVRRLHAALPLMPPITATTTDPRTLWYNSRLQWRLLVFSCVFTYTYMYIFVCVVPVLFVLFVIPVLFVCLCCRTLCGGRSAAVAAGLTSSILRMSMGGAAYVPGVPPALWHCGRCPEATPAYTSRPSRWSLPATAPPSCPLPPSPIRIWRRQWATGVPVRSIRGD